MTAKTKIQYKPNILPESEHYEQLLDAHHRWNDYKGANRMGKQAVMFYDDIHALFQFYHVCERSELDYKNKCELTCVGNALIYDANGNLIRGRYDKQRSAQDHRSGGQGI